MYKQELWTFEDYHNAAFEDATDWLLDRVAYWHENHMDIETAFYDEWVELENEVSGNDIGSKACSRYAAQRAYGIFDDSDYQAFIDDMCISAESLLDPEVADVLAFMCVLNVMQEELLEEALKMAEDL